MLDLNVIRVSKINFIEPYIKRKTTHNRSIRRQRVGTSLLVELVGPRIQMRKSEMAIKSFLQPFVDVQNCLQRTCVALSQQVNIHLFSQIVFIVRTQEFAVLALSHIHESYQTHHFLQDRHSLRLHNINGTCFWVKGSNFSRPVCIAS